MKINIGFKPGQKAYMFDPCGHEEDYSIYKIKRVTIERVVGQIRVVATEESSPEIDLSLLSICVQEYPNRAFNIKRFYKTKKSLIDVLKRGFKEALKMANKED